MNLACYLLCTQKSQQRLGPFLSILIQHQKVHNDLKLENLLSLWWLNYLRLEIKAVVMGIIRVFIIDSPIKYDTQHLRGVQITIANSS